MKLRAIHVSVLVLLAIFGTIAVTSIAGIWVTEGRKTPRRITEGAFAGAGDPADIRGSYSLGDIETAFDIPVAVLAAAFGLPDGNVSDLKAKDLEALYGQIGELELGTDSLRLFVSLYLGIPYTPDETTALPRQAYDILVSANGPSADTPGLATSFADRVVVIPESGETGTHTATEANDASIATVGEADHEPGTEERLVSGRTTFADLLNWGLKREQIDTVLGGPMPARATLVRDFASAQGAPFKDYRDAFQQLLDAGR